MCKMCLQSSCPSACPYAPEPIHVFICSGCGGSILEGESYWDIMGEQWCQGCINDAEMEAVYDPD